MNDKEFIEQIEKWIEENTDEGIFGAKRDNSSNARLHQLRGGNIPPPKIRDASRKMLRCIVAVALLAAIAMIIVRVMFHPVVVTGSSMEPTLHNGEILRTTTKIIPSYLKRGVVICFKVDGKPLIKRIVGLPGETISFKDGYVYINGEKLNDDFEKMTNYPEDEIVLGNDEYYCLGDNRNNSNDSRDYGPVHLDDITGIATADLMIDYREAKQNLEKDVQKIKEIKSTEETTEQ